MAYRKRGESTEVTKANQRLDKVKTIEEEFDLGNGYTKAAYEEKIAAVVTQTAVYNKKLTEVDTELIILEKKEKELADFTEGILKSVGLKYGSDSMEYEMAGGTRKSDIKRPSSSNTVNTPVA